MVFGWGKKKDKKQEIIEPEQKEKEIKLSQVRGILDEVISLRRKTIISQVKTFRKKTEYSRNEILKIANDLERDDLKTDDIDRHLKLLVIRGKKLVISTIKNESKVQLPEINSFDDALKFNTLLSQTLKKTGDILGQQSRVIHIFAKKYAAKLKTHLEVLNSDLSEINSLIDNISTLQTRIEEIENNVNQLNEFKNSIKENEKRISEIKQRVTNYDKKIQNIKENIEKFKTSDKYSKYQELQKKIDSLSSDRQKIKSQIDLQFTKISRPLNKYEYVSSLDKPQKKLMNNLLEEPIDVLIPANKDSIMEILNAVKRGVISGSVSVKDTEKSTLHIDETISMLDGFIQQISELSDKTKTLEDNLNKLNINELKDKESELSKTINDKSDSETKSQNLEHEISEMNGKIPNIINEIEIVLRSTSSTKYKIII